MMLAAFLLIGAFAAGNPQNAPASTERAEIQSDLLRFLADGDRDGDGKLSLAEWTAMVGRALPALPSRDAAHAVLAEARAAMIDEHARMDRDQDGKVSFDELIREPMANFDCKDGDRDLRLSAAEIQSARTRCPSRPMARIGFISEPQPDAAPGR